MNLINNVDIRDAPNIEDYSLVSSMVSIKSLLKKIIQLFNLNKKNNKKFLEAMVTFVLFKILSN